MKWYAHIIAKITKEFNTLTYKYNSGFCKKNIHFTFDVHARSIASWGQLSTRSLRPDGATTTNLKVP